MPTVEVLKPGKAIIKSKCPECGEPFTAEAETTYECKLCNAVLIIRKEAP